MQPLPLFRLSSFFSRRRRLALRRALPQSPTNPIQFMEVLKFRSTNIRPPAVCLAAFSACAWIAGCANTPATQVSTTPGPTTQGSFTLGPTAEGTATGVGTCYSACRPDLTPRSTALKPGESATFSVWVFSQADTSITWTIQEGSAGGAISGVGTYTAPSAEGIYHLTVTSKATPSQTTTATIVVTNTQFTAIAGLITSRNGHTASLLRSGQVLIAGGVDSDYWDTGLWAVSAELYDPATSSFHPAAQVARWEHSATVLANGDVLLAGGETPTQNATTSADLFKAASGTIQATANMTTPRVGHSSTLLQDGRVFLAGGTDSGENGGKALKSAELYDPASGTFTPAGDMITARSSPSATLLPNGRVLIVSSAAGAELYDPATNSFLPAPGVAVGRCQVTAALLADGRVLLAGGVDCSNYLLDTAEVYDPATGQSTATGKLVAGQAGNTATLLSDGRVLLVGGGSPYLSQIYSPATGTFAFGPHPTQNTPLWWGHTATLLLDGSVLITDQDTSSQIYRY